jgi:hypothetical protein
MFPALFLHNNVSMFQCETYELSKHHRVSFSPNINKSDAPFVLVHTDVSHKWSLYLVIGGLSHLLMVFLRPHASTC